MKIITYKTIYITEVIKKNLRFYIAKSFIVLIMKLDAGSNSNLSPEQVITSFTKFSQLYLPREDIEVERKYLIFDPCIPQTLGLHLQKPKKEE